MPEMQMILEKIGPGRAEKDFVLYACRGEGRGCSRNKYRSRKVHCEDCVGPLDEKKTLGEIYDGLKRGDA